MALPMSPGSRPGQSLPTRMAHEESASADASADNMRSPRSAPFCERSVTWCLVTQFRKQSCFVSGEHQSSTGCPEKPQTVFNVRSRSRPWSSAAPSAPRAGMRRVFAWPGTGARANTSILPLVIDSGAPGRQDRRRGSNAGAASTSVKPCATPPGIPSGGWKSAACGAGRRVSHRLA